MTDNSLDFEIKSFDGQNNEFLELAFRYFEHSSQYRGYGQLVELIEGLEIGEYDLYQAVHHGVRAGLAAVRLSGKILHFDIFVVDYDFREIGIGDELFEYIVKQDKYKEAELYESRALPGDRHTKNFFETRKGKARLLIVSGELGNY